MFSLKYLKFNKKHLMLSHVSVYAKAIFRDMTSLKMVLVKITKHVKVLNDYMEFKLC